MNYKVIYEQTSRRPNWNVRDTVLWCIKTFGPIGPRWDWTFARNEDMVPQMIFFFNEEADSTQFKLAWL